METRYSSLREKIAAEKAERQARYTKFEELYQQAHAAGDAAAKACVPRAMVVGTPTKPFGSDIDYTKQVWVEPEGVCGFAWIKITPATCSFARWLKKTGKVRDGRAWDGGVDIWVRDYGQSMQRKEAYANAFARVLNEAGIRAYAQSRLD